MVSLTTPTTVQKGVVPISYTLYDPASLTCTIAVAYSTNGGNTYQPATPGAAGDGTADLVSSAAGTPHVFAWNSLADGVALGGPDHSVRIRITPADTAPGGPGATSNFTVNNKNNTPPSLTISPVPGTVSGLVAVTYSLTDAQSDPCTLQAAFSTDGGTSYAPATRGPGGDGLVHLTSSPGGAAHTFLWNSVADGVAPSGPNGTVRIRLQPADGATGAATATANFSVDNSGKGSGSSLAGYPIQVNGSSDSDWATCVATDGVSIYTLGFEEFDFESASGNSNWRLRKRTIATGAAVPGFGTAGTLSVNPGPGLDIPFKVILSGGALFVLYARETGSGSGSFEVRVDRRNADTGALINSFGNSGTLHTGSTPGAFDGIPLPWTMAADGSFLYVAGPQKLSADDAQWRIEKRDKTTGALVAGFGAAGRVEEDLTPDVDGCFSIVVGAASMWLVGTEGVDANSSSNGRIRIEKRNLLDGALDSGFGAGGAVTVDAGAGDDIAEDAASDGASLFVYSRVETALGSGLFQGRLEKRDPATGALGPVVTGSASDPTGELPFGHLAIDGGSIFVCQADGSPDAQWRVEKRSTSTLSLVTSFGTAGVLEINPAVSGYDRPLGIVAVGGVVLLAGMDSTASDEQWRIEARWK